MQILSFKFILDPLGVAQDAADKIVASAIEILQGIFGVLLNGRNQVLQKGV